MRKLVVAGLTALLVANFPLAVMAQATAFDDETREIVIEIVQRVGGTVGPGGASAPTRWRIQLRKMSWRAPSHKMKRQPKNQALMSLNCPN